MITWGTFSYPECPTGLFPCNKCCAREQQTCLTWHAHNVKSAITNICNKRILQCFMSYRMTDNVSLELNVLLPSESESESVSESTTTGLLAETLCLPFGTRSIGKTCQESRLLSPNTKMHVRSSAYQSIHHSYWNSSHMHIKSVSQGP